MTDILKNLYSAGNFYVFLTVFFLALSFSQEHRKGYWHRIAISGVLGIIIVFLFSSFASNGGISYIIKYFICFLLSTCVVAFSHKMNVNELAYFGTCAYAMQHFAYSLLMIFISALQLGGVNIEIGSNCFIILEILFNVGIFALIYYFFARNLKKLTAGVKDTSVLIPLIVMLVVAVILDVNGFEVDNTRIRIVMMAYAAFVCITMLYAMYKVFEISSLVIEKETVQELTRKQKEQYEIQKKNIEYINIKCHDLRKQLGYLAGGEVSDEKINEIKRQTRIYDAVAKTGNETLDVILTERSLFCEQENIRLTYIADGELLSAFDAVDICAVFANLLDNAIEAVMKLPEEERIISLKLDAIGNFIHIVVYNLFDQKLKIDGKEIQTTKRNEIDHGFGLKSVRMAVDNYRGEMKVYVEDNVFNVNILIPIK